MDNLRFIRLEGKNDGFVVIRAMLPENVDSLEAVGKIYQYYEKHGFKREDIKVLSGKDGVREELKVYVGKGILMTGDKAKGKYDFRIM